MPLRGEGAPPLGGSLRGLSQPRPRQGRHSAPIRVFLISWASQMNP